MFYKEKVFIPNNIKNYISQSKSSIINIINNEKYLKEKFLYLIILKIIFHKGKVFVFNNMKNYIL